MRWRWVGIAFVLGLAIIVGGVGGGLIAERQEALGLKRWQRGVHVDVTVRNGTSSNLSGLAIDAAGDRIPLPRMVPGENSRVRIDIAQVSALRLVTPDTAFAFLGAILDPEGISGSVALDILDSDHGRQVWVVERTKQHPDGPEFGTGQTPGGVYPAREVP